MPYSALSPLPGYLVQRYRGWKATNYNDNKSWYHRLAEEGQHPRAMIISCCDSRVHVTAMFGADTGEFFIHRNIANLVPPFKADQEYHGTSAALEYAVASLKVAHVIIIGHSGCGGVKGGHAHFSGAAPEQFGDTSFVGRWIEILRPGYERLEQGLDEEAQLAALEKQAVLVSMENLMTFPFVKQAVDADRLSLHGLWHDIGSGVLSCYDPASGVFEPV